MQTVAPTVKSDTMDRLSVSLAEMQRQLDSAHIALLERVNDQLALTTNPLALLIGALGVLFTIGAIVMAVLIFSQGRSFRKRLDATLGRAEEVTKQTQLQVESFIAGVRVQVDEIHAQLSQRVDEATTRAAEATGQVKSAIEKELKSLTALKERVERQRATLSEIDHVEPLGQAVPDGSYVSAAEMLGYTTKLADALTIKPMVFANEPRHARIAVRNSGFRTRSHRSLLPEWLGFVRFAARTAGQSKTLCDTVRRPYSARRWWRGSLGPSMRSSGPAWLSATRSSFNRVQV